MKSEHKFGAIILTVAALVIGTLIVSVSIVSIDENERLEGLLQEGKSGNDIACAYTRNLTNCILAAKEVQTNGD